MTRQKKLKKAIRARVRKTGERYAAARRQLLTARKRRAARPSSTGPSKPKPAKPSRASAGSQMSDAKVRERTGRSLDHWFERLDSFGAAEKGHTAAARHLATDHGVDGWYAQGITVAYERARGLRDVNQRMSGFFEVTVSKALRIPMERVAAALSRSAERDAWLRGCDPALRKALEQALTGHGARAVKLRPGKDASVRYRAEGKTVDLRVLSKPGGRSSVVATVMKIPTASEKEAQRSAWRRALESLKAHLS
jgi:hypothetical protein